MPTAIKLSRLITLKSEHQTDALQTLRQGGFITYTSKDTELSIARRPFEYGTLPDTFIAGTSIPVQLLG